MSIVRKSRLYVFVIATVLAIITIGVGSLLRGPTKPLSLFTGSFTIAIFLAFLALDFIQISAVTLTIVIEIPTIAVLCILWLVTAGVVAHREYHCHMEERYCDHRHYHLRFARVEIIAFLNFINLFLYWIMLSACTLLAGCRGESPWKQSVKQANLSIPKPRINDDPFGQGAINLQLSQRDSASTKFTLTPPPFTLPPSYVNAMTHPGLPEPQLETIASPRFRTLNTIAGLANTPAYDHHNLNFSTTTTTTTQPLPSGAAPPAAHPGSPEPHTSMGLGLRNISSAGAESGVHAGPSGYMMPSSQNSDGSALQNLSRAYPSSPELRSTPASPELRSVRSYLSGSTGASINTSKPLPLLPIE